MAKKRTNKWEEYKITLLEYQKEIKRARRDTWRKPSTDINERPNEQDFKKYSQKIFSKAPTNPIDTILNTNEVKTETGREFADVLVQTHFPGSVIIYMKETAILPSTHTLRSATGESWGDAKKHHKLRTYQMDN